MDSKASFGIDVALYQKLAIGILALTVVLRVWNLTGTSLWYDEAVYLLNSQGTFSEVVENTQLRNSSPLGLPLLLWLIDGMFGLNALSARLPSVIFGVGAVGLMLALPRVGISRVTALVAAGLLAVGQLQIMYAQEVREYALSILASAAILWAFLNAVNNDRWRTLIGLAVLTPWLSYGACFAILAAIVSLIAMSLFKTMKPRWPAIGILAAAFLISALTVYFVVAQHQLYTGEVWYFAEHYLGQSGMNPMVWLVVNMAGIFLASLPGLIAVIAAPILLIVYLSRFLRSPLDIFSHPVIVITTVLAGGLVMAGVIEVYPFGSPRHSVFFGPFLCLGIAIAGIDILTQRSADQRSRFASGFLAIAAISAIVSLSAIPLGKGLHPALDKVAEINVYGEFEDNRGLFDWARGQAEQGRPLYGGPSSTPVAEIYGDGLTLAGKNFSLIQKPEAQAEDILRFADGRTIAVLINAPVPGDVEGVIAALRAKGLTVSEDFTAERTHGLVVEP